MNGVVTPGGLGKLLFVAEATQESDISIAEVNVAFEDGESASEVLDVSLHLE